MRDLQVRRLVDLGLRKESTTSPRAAWAAGSCEPPTKSEEGPTEPSSRLRATRRFYPSDLVRLSRVLT
jgi:hypothetical protein